MRTIELREYEQSEAVALSIAERDALRTAIPSLRIAPAAGSHDAYVLTPSSVVGAFELGDLSIRIRPKLSIRRVLYLAAQAMNIVDFRDEPFGFDESATPQNILAPAFIAAAQRAFSRGLMHGYRSVEDTLTTVRGRIDFAEQVRRRFDIPLPVEVRYDDFTEDVLINRLVKAAARRLAGLRIEEARWRRGLGRIDATLANVSLIQVPDHQLPTVEFDRLNEHYRDVVELSRLILRHTALDAARGDLRASGFMMNMNVVFQEYVTRALRQELGLSSRTFRADDGRAAAYLDVNDRIMLKPDFTWWQDGRCVFAGDAKYKITEDGKGTNADLYQALAYATALDLSGALLVYAEGKRSGFKVKNTNKRIEIGTVVLNGTNEELQLSMRKLAKRARSLQAESLQRRLLPAR
ncbi:MAG: hypothetical protein OXD50_04165 [Chloroflexi bacterium]|nr:hypothetical protein [Chloroflexota bacterium]